MRWAHEFIWDCFFKYIESGAETGILGGDVFCPVSRNQSCDRKLMMSIAMAYVLGMAAVVFILILSGND